MGTSPVLSLASCSLLQIGFASQKEGIDLKSTGCWLPAELLSAERHLIPGQWFGSLAQGLQATISQVSSNPQEFSGQALVRPCPDFLVQEVFLQGTTKAPDNPQPHATSPLGLRGGTPSHVRDGFWHPGSPHLL